MRRGRHGETKRRGITIKYQETKDNDTVSRRKNTLDLYADQWLLISKMSLMKAIQLEKRQSLVFLI